MLLDWNLWIVQGVMNGQCIYMYMRYAQLMYDTPTHYLHPWHTYMCASHIKALPR